MVNNKNSSTRQMRFGVLICLSLKPTPLIGKLTDTISSTGVPHSDGVLKMGQKGNTLLSPVSRGSVSSDSLHDSWREHRVTHTPGHLFGDFLVLIFWHPHREVSGLTRELSGGIWSVPLYSHCLHPSFALVIPPHLSSLCVYYNG